MTNWILAFDVKCGLCRDVADRVRQSVGDRIEVVSLSEVRIREMRERALGVHPVYVPTLLAVDGENVRAWTGTALSVRLARLLGPAGSLRVIRALKDADAVRAPERRRLLKTVPGLALGVFLLSGGVSTSAVAAPARGKASQWVLANADRLPTTYDEVVSYPMAYRKAIVDALPARTRGALWAEQIERFRKSQSHLSPAQTAVLDDAVRAASRAFVTDVPKADQDAVFDAAVAAFGEQDARALLMRFGPDDGRVVQEDADARRPLPDCTEVDCVVGTCSPKGCGYRPAWCNETTSGCGFLWLDPCFYVCL